MKIHNVSFKGIYLLLAISTLQGCTSVETTSQPTSTSSETATYVKQGNTLDSAENSPNTLTQVPYSLLASLETSAPSSVINYGPASLQRIYHWQHNAIDGKASHASAVIYVHGGCWLSAYDYAHANGFYHALTRNGNSVYAIEYRRTGDEGGGWPGSLQDVKLGVEASLDDIAAKGKHKSAFIVGHSAGGHLALLSVQDINQYNSQVKVNAVVGLAAITDIARYARGENSCQRATSAFMASTPDENPSSYFNATPVVADNSPTVLLLQGDADNIVPKHHAYLMGTTQIIIPDGGHFDWLHPKSTSFNALLDVLGEHYE